MAHADHLQRLAFGRSAFQDLPAVDQDAETTEQESQPGSGSVQLYDSKGRPRNPRTEDLNARLRHAQNEALALVGVVERKESADADAQIDATLARGVREHLLTQENVHGEELDSLATLSFFFVDWWPRTLVKRVHIGLYGSSMSFAGMLALQCTGLSGSGLQGLLRGVLPGCAISLLHRLVYHCLCAGIDETISSLQKRLISSGYRRRKTARLHAALDTLCEILLLSLDVVLAPLNMYASALQLGIAPLDTPWRTTCTLRIPSFFKYTYATIFASPTAFLTTPAVALLAVHNFLERDDIESEYSTPYFASLTTYRLPNPVSTTLSSYESFFPPRLRQDPFGVTLATVYTIRTKILQWLGWNASTSLLSHSRTLDGWATDQQTAHGDAGPPVHIGTATAGPRTTQHRSTALARLPAFRLAKSIDAFAVRLLLLPFEGLAMRSIASFYLASPMPVTAAGAALRLRRATPGLLSLLLKPSGGSEGWVAFGRRLSHLGLAIATSLAFEAACFAIVYRVVRRQGLLHFQWGERATHARHEVKDER